MRNLPASNFMRRLFRSLIALALLGSACGQALPYLFESDGSGPPTRIYWQTEPGVRYDLWKSDDLADWTRVTGYPAMAEGLAMEHAFTPGPKGFFQVLPIDEQPPVVTGSKQTPNQILTVSSCVAISERARPGMRMLQFRRNRLRLQSNISFDPSIGIDRNPRGHELTIYNNSSCQFLHKSSLHHFAKKPSVLSRGGFAGFKFDWKNLTRHFDTPHGPVVRFRADGRDFARNVVEPAEAVNPHAIGARTRTTRRAVILISRPPKLLRTSIQLSPIGGIR